MDAPVRDFDSAADAQQAEGGSARQKTAGRQGKAGIFSRKMGDFRGKVGRFSPVGGARGLRLGGNDGGLAASVKIEANKPRNAGQNGTKKSRRPKAFGACDSELGDVCLAEPASKERQEDGGHQPHDPDRQPTQSAFDSTHLDRCSRTDTMR